MMIAMAMDSMATESRNVLLYLTSQFCSTLAVLLRNRAIQIAFYLLTYLLTYLLVTVVVVVAAESGEKGIFCDCSKEATDSRQEEIAER